MGKSLLPQAFWFRLAASCPRVDEIPRQGARGGLLDLPAQCALPDLSSLDGRVSWASVRVGWNPQGLGVAILADGRGGKASLRDRPEGFADVNVWIDTRDTRNVSRATRFCHRFAAHLKLGRDDKSLEVEVSQRAIARAVADAPISPAGLISARAGPHARRLDPRALPAGPGASWLRSRNQSPPGTRRTRSPTTSATISSWASAAISPSARTPASGRRSS